VQSQVVWRKLVEFGLAEDEAKILASLYITGSSKANSIAMAVGLPRIRVYRALKGLQENNLVEAHLGRPALFSAVPMEEGLKSLITHAAVRLENLQRTKEEFMNEMSNFKIPESRIMEAKYRIIQGRGSLFSAIVKMINSASSEIIFFAVREELMRMYYAGILDTLLEAQTRGIKILILTEIDRSDLEIVEKFTKYFDIHHVTIPGISVFFVMDESEVLQSAMTKETDTTTESDSIALWTDGKNFAVGIKELLNEAWRNAMDAQTRIRALKNNNKLQDIVIIQGYETVTDFFVNMLSKAKTEILFASFPYDVKFFDPAIRAMITRLNQKNVKITILTQMNDDIMKRIKEISKITDFRHVDLPVMSNFLIIDGKEVTILPSALMMGGTTAIWSNSQGYVESYRSIFDNLLTRSSTISHKLLLMEETDMSQKIEKMLDISLKELGYEVKRSIKGMSGLIHDFNFVGTDPATKETIVIDVIASKNEEMVKTSIITFIAKCLDVGAEHKVLVTDISSELLEQFERPYERVVKIVNYKDVDKVFAILKQGQHRIHRLK
jgi:sugar-specific transcriptional regulator TrmB